MAQGNTIRERYEKFLDIIGSAMTHTWKALAYMTLLLALCSAFTFWTWLRVGDMQERLEAVMLQNEILHGKVDALHTSLDTLHSVNNALHQPEE